MVTMFRSAFPDAHTTIEDEIAEGDKVVTRWSSKGTQQGEFMGLPASGKSVTWSWIAIHDISDGKLIEYTAEFDAMGLMQQLGVIRSQ